jgi:hypothetical protein
VSPEDGGFKDGTVTSFLAACLLLMLSGTFLSWAGHADAGVAAIVGFLGVMLVLVLLHGV